MHRGSSKNHVCRCFLMQIVSYEVLVIKACAEIAGVMFTIKPKQQKVGMTV